MNGATCSSSSSLFAVSSTFLPVLSPSRRRISSNFSSVYNNLFFLNYRSRLVFSVAAGRGTNSNNPIKKKAEEIAEEDEVEEEDLPWIQEKALDLVEFTGSVTQALPGPRVGQTSFPWLLAVPLAYVGVSFVLAVVKTVKKFNSPKEKRRKLVNKNAVLCKSIDDLFAKGRDAVDEFAYIGLMQKTGFAIDEILRKYIRYAFNEKPFNTELVSNLIQLRKASGLDDSQVTEILSEISKRIIKDKGPLVMDASGYSERGFKKKLALQALFGKIYYISELPEFCSKDSSVVVKEIFGLADEDAEKLRVHTVSEAGLMDSLEKIIDGSESDSEDSSDSPSTPP